LDQLGRYTEAQKDWDSAVALAAGQRQDVLRMKRVDKLARSGHHARATAEAAILTEKKKPAIDYWYYDLACVYSVAAAAAAAKDPKLPAEEKTRLAEGYAARAVRLLAKAVASGEFNDPSLLANFKKDEDLRSLRQREDFRQFLTLVKSKERPSRK
jgi:hypothetical protein